ncbi:FeS assembly protein SufD [Aeropyrum pernix K1]|uniref:FeS assembly protein SufD n=1 Tax=Aeropyrum pernix (strain ATCC 700893 / DSM 11879 / JCM 9820 / NBRC 100138 / K1) TaxID=272557 RepID=Q9YB91_AERPE|nr:SufD family Fe-S cluster assembly protein [Aeropyrum pernix]BAA80707.1 FeS assembly protein SufD [Aeropyrum pernix K1]
MASSIIAREELRKLVKELPFQEIADTPTVKYYTDWKVYEKLMDLDYAESVDTLPEHIARSIQHKPAIHLGSDLTVGVLPKGVKAEKFDLETAASMEGLKPFTLVRADGGRMQAYHALRFNLGVKITVEPGTDFGSLAIASLGGQGYLGHHVVIEVGEGAKGEIIYIDYSVSPGLKTTVVEARMGRDAEVEVTNIVLHGSRSAVYTLRGFEVLDKASLEQYYLISGGRMTRFQDDNLLDGRLSSLKALASTVARPNTASDVIISSLHNGPESDGEVRARGVVVGNGYLAQRGVAMLGETARLAASEVESYIFLLSEKGKGYAVPVLEIHTGEITRAGHSAAVASLAEDTIFYLKSRGLDDKDIVTLVMEGITRFSGVLEKMEIPFNWLINLE